MINALIDFTVTPEYHRNRTVYHIRVKGAKDPVAQLRKDSAYGSRRPLIAYTGQALDQRVGAVAINTASDARGVVAGEVNWRQGAIRKDSWTFSQPGLPELHGERAGAVSAVREAWPARMVLADGGGDSVFSVRLRFSAPGCEGFEITRPSGVRARYRVRVYDERVSRLLILSCVVQYNMIVDADPRKNVIDTISNPFK